MKITLMNYYHSYAKHQIIQCHLQRQSQGILTTNKNFVLIKRFNLKTYFRANFDRLLFLAKLIFVSV